jgi:hypothetical protein
MPTVNEPNKPQSRCAACVFDAVHVLIPTIDVVLSAPDTED